METDAVPMDPSEGGRGPVQKPGGAPVAPGHVSSSITGSSGAEMQSSETVDKCLEIRMWQQSNYLADSGIQSAMGTQTPSLSSKIGRDELNVDDQLAPQKSCCITQWSSNIPMSLKASDSALLSPETPSTGSMLGVDTFGDESHSTSNVDLRDDKLPEIDTDEAASAIPELVKLIKDEDDQVIIYQSSMMVFQLSKSEAIDALIRSKDMIDCIISALDRTNDPETVRFLSGTLYNLSQTQTGLKAIFASSCVPCLVKLLNSPVESVLFYAITTLHNLLLHQDGAKNVVRQSGCLQKMTSLLRKNNIKFLTICTDCLQILAYGHQESKLQILSSGGPLELVRILRSYQYEKLLWTTARVLKVLSVCTSNKPAIISAGGMDALAKHLHSSSHRLVLNCLWALRNLSDAATKLSNLQPLLQSLVQILDCGDPSMVTCAAGILSNLTCNNHANKFIVYKLGGIQGLLRAVGHVGTKEDILEPCMCALRHLTSRHEEEETARHMIVHELAGLPLLARILHAATAGICPELGLVCQPPQTPVTSWMLLKAMVGLLRNLSVNLDSHFGMREYGLVTGLFLLLYATQFEILKRSSSSSVASPAFATMVQSVRLEEIVEGICGALHMLAKDHATRSYLALLRAPNLVITPSIQPGSSGLAIFVHLLYSPHESIQRAAAGVLAEVSQDRDGLDALANIAGASTRFEELVHSRNEAVSTYASAVVIRLSEERKGISGSSCIFPSHVEVLNTPPLPMDTAGSYQVPPLHQTPIVVCPSAPQGSNIWPHQFPAGPLPQDPSISGSPPPNSLTEMLGPPPATYKGPAYESYCSCWPECTSPGGCPDPNCPYSTDRCEPTNYGVAAGPYPAGRNGHRFDVPTPGSGGYASGSNYPGSGHVSAGEPATVVIGPNFSDLPQGCTNVPASVGPPSGSRRTGFGSLDTSGYMSPSSEVYMLHSPSHKPPLTASRQSRPGLAACNAPAPGSALSSMVSPQQPPAPGYLSPELMSLDETNSDWLPSQDFL
ncbi:unnamed protein product [Calicophoron daubneyi]|uniref:Beta-catenin n=1 Tax=Calicophoron daubneyi TaxID=300641 RepID=A0AAV2T6F5_CALDB